MRFEEPERNSIRNELQINQARREHVVECHQTFYSDGRISIVLEYMDGGSLADILKHKGKIGEAHLAAISKQVPTCLPTYLPIYLPIYFPIYLPTYLINYLPTYLPTYLPIYLPTCLLH